jgi:hypothetical protein
MVKRKRFKERTDDTKRRKGWTLPGYNYMGPGNSLENGPPTSADDAIAREHDYGYQKLLDEGENPYWNFNEADEKALANWGNSFGGLVAKGVFTAKKHLAKHKVLGTITKKLAKKDAMPLFGVLSEQERHERDNQRRREELDRDRIHTIPDDNVDMGQNQPAAAPVPVNTLARSTGSTRGAMGGETPISPFQHPQLRPFPMTKNAILPYYAQSSLTLSATQTDTGAAWISIRMNSIYDVLTTLTYVADPTPAADAAGGTVEAPIMRTFYTQIYDYWTVVGAEIKIRFWSEDRLHQEIEVFQYAHGQQVPPFCNSTGMTGGLLWKKHRLMHPNMTVKSFKLGPTTNTEKSAFDRGCEFYHHYSPRNNLNAVAEDEFQETWHRQSEVPSQHEKMTWIVQRSERSAFADATTIKYDLSIVYYVQYKDLKAVFQYPYPAGDATFTDFAVQT